MGDEETETPWQNGLPPRDRIGVFVGITEHGNVEMLGRAILDLWRHRGRLHETYRADADYVNQFSSANLARRVDGLLRGILDARGGSCRRMTTREGDTTETQASSPRTKTAFR